MKQRLTLITLGVADLQKSIAFYEALGWKNVSQDEGIAAFNMLGMALALYPNKKLAEDVTRPVNSSGYAPVTLAYNCESRDEVDQVIAEARAIGADILKEPQEVFWGGYSSYFADPDGHLWEVAHNPFSPLGPEGEFQWGGAA